MRRVLFLIVALCALVSACGSTAGHPGSQCTTGSVDRLSSSAPNKIDLLLVVDNSPSMADKQAILATVVPDLLSGLANPACLDDTTGAPVAAATQPADPLAACPAGSTRDFPPVTDIHVGLLSSSLGTFGVDGCKDPPPPAADCGLGATDDDRGHLVTRSDPCGVSVVPTYESEGFLAWDPKQQLLPPGIQTAAALEASLHELVIGDGQLGCAFESQDEAWYRFLVEPIPYQSITLVNNQVQTSGVDGALVAQRRDFLRPDSLLAIVDVSDKDDASIKEFSSYPLFAAPELHLPHARSECATRGPLDACCASCGQETPPGCAPDPQCTSNPSYTAADEDTALRAFGLISHKARYGIEFFYPPSRYVAALTSARVTDVDGDQVQNPIFANLDPTRYTGAPRDPSLVFYAAIVGVPWQLIARTNPMTGAPDLVDGVSATDPTQVGGFKSSDELALHDAQGNTFWDDIVGDPERYVPARSPYMQESTVPRTGTDPVTGIAISPTTSPSGTNPINGHERTIASPPGDIEYACVFPTFEPIDCSDPSTVCDCTGKSPDDPLCDPNPGDGGKPTLQTRAKAYPGLKELAIVKGLGTQGIAASICAKQVTDATAADYGYRPAVKAILDRLRQALHSAACLPRTLAADSGGQVACTVLEASTSAACNCDGPGRIPVPAADQCLVGQVEADPFSATTRCFCEIPQATGPALADCQNSAVVQATTNGWCYVDDSGATPIGDPALVAQCPATAKRTLRFVGAGEPAPGATIFVSCPGL